MILFLFKWRLRKIIDLQKIIFCQIQPIICHDFVEIRVERTKRKEIKILYKEPSWELLVNTHWASWTYFLRCNFLSTMVDCCIPGFVCLSENLQRAFLFYVVRTIWMNWKKRRSLWKRGELGHERISCCNSRRGDKVDGDGV